MSRRELKLTDSLTFSDLREKNWSRMQKWHGVPVLGYDKWGYVDYSNAMCGEAGETANVVKKLRRDELDMAGNKGKSRAELLREAADEIGDTLCYLDLLATKLGLRLEDCIRSKFNRKSEEMGFEERI